MRQQVTLRDVPGIWFDTLRDFIAGFLLWLAVRVMSTEMCQHIGPDVVAGMDAHTKTLKARLP